MSQGCNLLWMSITNCILSLNVFVQIIRYICSNCQMYLFTFQKECHRDATFSKCLPLSSTAMLGEWSLQKKLPHWNILSDFLIDHCMHRMIGHCRNIKIKIEILLIENDFWIECGAYLIIEWDDLSFLQRKVIYRSRASSDQREENLEEI